MPFILVIMEDAPSLWQSPPHSLDHRLKVQTVVKEPARTGIPRRRCRVYKSDRKRPCPIWPPHRLSLGSPGIRATPRKTRPTRLGCVNTVTGEPPRLGSNTRERAELEPPQTQ
jgi:hypothetical protein